MIIGYVYNLSRVSQGAKCKWFNMKLQTANGLTRAICFSKEKYNIFAEKESSISPVKITKHILTFSHDGNE